MFICQHEVARIRAVLKEPDFFLLRTAPRDHQPPTAKSHQPPTATNRQPPTATNRQRRPTANRQPLPTATNHQSPTTNRRQPPPTASCQVPTANRRQPPTANRQPPPTMVEHMECPRDFLGKLCNGNSFFFPLRTALSKMHQTKICEKKKMIFSSCPAKNLFRFLLALPYCWLLYVSF